uniref:Uncharacterized protein n=1 Tax=Anopheles atroparvus TaxID=41427 RepID=A0AAG5CXR1_ANOAO
RSSILASVIGRLGLGPANGPREASPTVSSSLPRTQPRLGGQNVSRTETNWTSSSPSTGIVWPGNWQMPEKRRRRRGFARLMLM